MPEASLLVLTGAFAGGVVSGMTGFGTGLTALPIWLLGITPALAAPLVVTCSLVAQLQTLPAIWRAIDFRRCAPFIFGGLTGVPFGACLLPFVSVQGFKLAVGTLLVAYCGFALFGKVRFQVRRAGWIADALIGLGGGLLGGLAGLSGPLPTIWAGLRGWDKDTKRAVFQAFNTSILAFALVSQAVAGLMTAQLGQLVLFALPGTILGAWLGRRVYNTLNNAMFEKAVLVVLMLSGLMLLLSAARS
ncbi:MAG: sulfite exporter TauE/SafE family protein [Betaproteobacteria bacterium]|nr:sulfite exporter TauE/SafE family protein [Betaproteobacteria bacterium]